MTSHSNEGKPPMTLWPKSRRVRARLATVARFVGIAAALVLGSGTASAVKLSVDLEVERVGGWRIGFSDHVSGCVARRDYRNGTVLWIGESDWFGYFLAVEGAGWRWADVDQAYEIDMNLIDQGMWRGRFTGIEKGVGAKNLPEAFLGEFRSARAIALVRDGRGLSSLQLDGSSRAIDAVLECRSERLADDEFPSSRPQVARANVDEPRPARPPVRSKASGYGTGFFVSRAGDFVTNEHVVRSCRSIEVTPHGGRPVSARLAARDTAHDLALLEVDYRPTMVAPFRSTIRLGETVSVFGYPLPTLISSAGNFTSGSVSALAGLADNATQLQISAPVQPGNSGGPLLDGYGNVVGVVVAKLNALAVAQRVTGGDIPQNVNFAVKSEFAERFLAAQSVDGGGKARFVPLAPTEVAERAMAFTARVTCAR